MNRSRFTLFAEEEQADDMIDRIFSQLPQMTPPDWLIQRILDSVSDLSKQKNTFSPIPLDDLIVRHDDAEPS